MTAHRDAVGARLGMWLFLVTEFVLFGGLFLAYASQRHRFPADFHAAAARMDLGLGLVNTVLLLTSSLTVALAASAFQQGLKARTLGLFSATLILGLAFLANKGLEWGAKFQHGLYPGAPQLAALPQGEQVFLGLYYTLTGLHGFHLAAGLGLFAGLLAAVATGRLGPERSGLLENGGLFWHLVDVIWLFLLPLFYLA